MWHDLVTGLAELAAATWAELASPVMTDTVQWVLLIAVIWKNKALSARLDALRGDQ